MMKTSVMHFFGLLWIVGAALGADDYVMQHESYLNNNPADWQSARETCMGRQSSLSSCDLSTLADQAMGAGLTSGSYYWIGARKRDVIQWTDSGAKGEALFEAVGCFDMGMPMTPTIRESAYNSPARCLSKCTENYAALKNTTCYCVDATKVMSWSRQSSDMCPINCNYESYQCGGSDNIVSVYKIPDDTVLQVQGRAKKYFWRRSNNNQKEYIVITNKPRRTQGKTCDLTNNQYIQLDWKSKCPAGSELLSFRDLNVTEFLRTAYWLNIDSTDYQLPLSFSRQMLWLDGRKVMKSSKGVRGGCLAISLSDKDSGYFLFKRKCTDKLPSVCGCSTKTMIATTTTEATTTTTEPTTTTTEPTTTTTEPMTTTTEPTTTTTEPTTEPTTTPTTTEMMTTASTTPEPTTTTMTITTPAPTTSTASTTAEPSSTSTSEQPTTSIPPGGVWTTAPKQSSPVTAPRLKDTSTVAPGMAPTTGAAQGGLPTTNNSVLFPFHFPNQTANVLEPAPVAPSQTRDDDDQDTAASAGLSMEVIVGVTIGVIVVAILVVFVLVVVIRRRRTNSSSLLKKERSSKGNTNYPI